MIIKNNPLLYVNVESEVGITLQYLAAGKGFTWQNGKKIYNPYFPTYALTFDLDNKMMYYYPTREALVQMPEGKRTLQEIKKILNNIGEQNGTKRTRI